MIKPIVIIGTIILLTGCQTAPPEENRKSAENEAAMAQEWQGKHVNELLKTYGKPSKKIDTTVIGSPPKLGYMYQLEGNSCVMLFDVVAVTGLIVNYYCM